MYVHIHTCIHVYISKFIHIYIYTCIHTCMCTHARTYTHTHTYAHKPRICIRTHEHTNAHTHIHSHTLPGRAMLRGCSLKAASKSAGATDENSQNSARHSFYIVNLGVDRLFRISTFCHPYRPWSFYTRRTSSSSCLAYTHTYEACHAYS